MSGTTAIQTQLFALRDEGYRDFHARLMPTVDKARIIGVRTPALRALARELYGTAEAEDFLRALPHEYYEENNLHARLIMCGRDFDAVLAQTEAFLPFVDNWATCDGLSPKVFARHRAALLPCIDRWLTSDHVYTVRFGIKMLMEHFLCEDFSPVFLEKVAAVRSEEYYVNMMCAWYFATALAKQYGQALPYLTEQRLPRWTHNKTIQKAVESYRITPEQKEFLRALRLK